MATIAQEEVVATENKKELSTFQALPDNNTHYTDRVDALRLIADSVAQQRQDASRALITNPITIAVCVAISAAFAHYLDDLATVVVTTAGCLMAGMAGVGYFTYGYLDLAEKTGTWSFLRDGDKEEDILLVTKYGDEVIGALVLRLISHDKKKKTKKAVIRAWTVKRRYRNKGIGASLLEEVVALCKKNGYQGPEFAPDHANSKRILPKMLQRNLDRAEKKARSLLDRVKGGDSTK